ncbi:glucosamine-6-phosphate deaminase [Chitinivibrio alkaliphilus]|uniref:Glucosamine-6-phosphate deaminase n=1 Tax=Chitinivibrio alkaliphilus ACht1 TaxID=1313304 RepID=U7DB45_9BACT|nr:glucosamine-6-phosphate deaminase [Chitinivibrio alkaliphilus]ERP31635.1 glucosamine-6-phosphate deaminase [Chitinivibrio alkaliphilus ACht1]
MEVIVRRDKEAATDLVARLVVKQVMDDPTSVLGLATGRTMEAVYDRLVDIDAKEGVDFSHVSTFNLDEYVGLAPEDENSYRSYMNKYLFDRVNINKANTYIPNGIAEDLEEECRMYEAKIRAAGGIDFQLLGIGSSGHIGFNEPLSALLSLTRVKALNPETIEQNSPLFPSPEMMPRRAITMGVDTIIKSRRAVLLATGESKAEIIAKAVEGPLTSIVTASALQLHKHCTIVVDEDAAKLLKMRDYYDWVFNNEPEWEDFR